MKSIKIKHLILLAGLLFSYTLKAQDLIVTSKGDSLNCKIAKVKGQYIYFTYKHEDEIRNTLMPIAQVKFQQTNFYQTVEVPADKILESEDYPHFRIAVNGGYSYILARLSSDIPKDFESYYKGLKSGYHYSGDIAYYFTEQLGIGFKYLMFRSSGEIVNVYATLPDGTVQYGKLSDDVSTSFVGPLFSTRFLDKNKRNSFIMAVGLGYMGYTDDAVAISSLLFKGSTIGLCWDIGYDIGITDNFAIGFQISCLDATLMQYDLTKGGITETIKLDQKNYEGLSRLDLSIGLRINL